MLSRLRLRSRCNGVDSSDSASTPASESIILKTDNIGLGSMIKPWNFKDSWDHRQIVNTHLHNFVLLNLKVGYLLSSGLYCKIYFAENSMASHLNLKQRTCCSQDASGVLTMFFLIVGRTSKTAALFILGFFFFYYFCVYCLFFNATSYRLLFESGHSFSSMVRLPPFFALPLFFL